MKNRALRSVFAIFTIFSLVLNSISPLLQVSYAEELNSPTPTAEQTTTGSTLAPTETPTETITPTSEASLTSTAIDTPTPTSGPIITVEPTAQPTATPTPEPTNQPETPTPAPADNQNAPFTLPTSITPWVQNQDSSYTTSGVVELNKEYTAPQNDKVRVKFTNLPSTSGNLTIKEIKLSADQIKQTGSISDTAYDITSSMQNGTFSYDLTLPIPSTSPSNIEVKSADTMGQIGSAQALNNSTEKTSDAIVVKGINHFTLFLVGVPGTPVQVPPYEIYGQVSINGANAPAGVTITAIVGGVQTLSTTTDSLGRYGYSSGSGGNGSFIIPLVGSDTALQLSVAGIIATSTPNTASLAAGSITRVDLAAAISQVFTSVAINVVSGSTPMNVGATMALGTFLYDQFGANYTGPIASANWTSVDPVTGLNASSIATVDIAGTVTAVSGGNARIKFTASDGTNPAVSTYLDIVVNPSATPTATPTITPTPSPVATSLIFTQEPSTTASTGAAFAQQPTVKIVDQYGVAMPTASDSVVLDTYTDSQCSTPTANYTLIGSTSMQTVSGVAAFTGVADYFPETAYLGAFSGSGLLNIACSQNPIVVTGPTPFLASVSINPPGPASVDIGATLALGTYLNDQSGNNYYGPLTLVNWASDQPSIASIDYNGIITGVSSGTASITFTASDGVYTRSVSISITVNPPATPTPPSGPTATLITVTPISVTYGDSSITVSAKLTRTDGVTPVSGVGMNLSFFGTAVSSLTGADGVATLIAGLHNYDVPGVYPTGLSAVFNGDSSYQSSSASASVTIVDKVASFVAGAVTANDKVYDGTNSVTLNLRNATLSNISNLLVSDQLYNLTLDTSSASGVFADRNVGNNKTVATSGFIFHGGFPGDASGNYTLVQPTLTANITAKPLTVSGITASNKSYDGTTAATINVSGASLSGVIPGDSVTLNTSSATGTFVDKNIGAGKTVTISGLTLTGADAGNYTINPITTTADITTIPITVTADAKTKVYGASDPTLTYSITSGSLLSGDSLSGSLSRVTGTNVGTYAISSTLANSNYTITFIPANLTITAEPITIAAVVDTKVYDRTTTSSGVPTITSGALISGDTATWTQAFDNANVGTSKSLIPSGTINDGNGGANYLVTFANNTSGVIQAKSLTVAGLTADNKIYDGNTTATISANSPSLLGIISPDVVTLNVGSLTGVFSDKNIGTGKTVAILGLTIGGANVANYTLTLPNASANITAKQLTVSAAGVNKIYDGTITASVNLSDDRIAGDTLTITNSGANFVDKNIGTGKTINVSGITITGTDAGNYTFNTTATTSGDISKLPITVTAVTDTKPYDGTTVSSKTPTTNIALATGDTATWAQTFDTKDVGTNKTLTSTGIVNDGNSGNNYAVTFATNLTGVITAAGVTVTADAQSKIYGSSDPTLTYQITSGALANGDSFTGSLTRVTGEDVGSYAIQQGTLALSADYILSFVGANLIITSKPVTITADAKSKIYGDADPALTATVSSGSLVGADTLSGSLTRVAGENVGTYAINQGTLTAGTNYSTTYVSADLTINKRPITISAATNTKVYDKTTNAAATPTVTFGNLKSGDTINFTEAYDDSNVGTGKTLTPAGTVNDGNSGNNYAVTLANDTTGVISAKPIIVTAVTDTKVYNRTTTSIGTPIITNGNLVAGDVATWAQTFNTKDVGSNKSLIPTGTITDGNSGNNYAITFVNNTTGVIQAKTLTATGITASDKVYDGLTTTSITKSTSLSGIISPDIVTIDATGATGAFLDKNVGTTKTVIISGLTIGGGDVANYTLTQPTATANITARPLTVGATGIDKVYDGTLSATVNLTDDRISGDALITGYTSATFTDKNAGNGITVNVAGINLTGGADAENYSLANTSTTATANITTRPLTVTAATGAKGYDGSTNSTSIPTVTGGSLAAGDTAVFSETYADPNVGTGKTLIPVVNSIVDSLNADMKANYNINLINNLIGVITDHALTISGVTANKTYDGSKTTNGVNVSGATLVGVVPGDNVTVDATGATGTFSDKNVGNGKTVVISGLVLGGTDAGKYTLTQPTITGNITAKTLTVSATGINKVYDGGTTATVTLSDDRVSGDALTVTNSGANFADKNVNTGKNVSVTGINVTGTDAENYSFNTTASTTADIIAAAITATADAKTKVYGASDPTLTYSITSGSLLSGDSLNGSLSRAAGENVGTYAISSTLANNNYAITFVPANFTITVRPITVTAVTDTKVYNRTTTSTGTPIVTVGSLVLGDTVTWTQHFDTKDVGTGKALIPTGTIADGNSGNNYVITFLSDTTGVIQAKTLTVNGISVTDKTYDGTTIATLNIVSPALVGIISPDSVTLDTSAATGTFVNSNVGTGISVTISGLIIGGVDVANYTLAMPNIVANITAAPTPTPTATPTITPTATPTPTIIPTATPTPTVIPTATPTLTVTPTPIVAPTATPTPTIIPTATPTPTAVLTPPAAPIASPIAGSYAAPQSITLTSARSSEILYSTSGIVANCNSGTLYTGPIAVNSSESIFVLACDNTGYSSSASFAYLINSNNFQAPANGIGQVSTSAVVTLNNGSSLDLSNGTKESTGSYTGGDLVGQNLHNSITVGGKPVEVEKSVKLNSTGDISLSNANLSNVSVVIPNNTTVLAPVGWDGKITPPTAGISSGSAPSGFSVGNTVIEVGSPLGILVFDQPVIITLTGVTGNVGYKPAGSDTWTKITTVCGGTYANPAKPTFPGECAISNGTDTEIYTYHFTSFASLDIINSSNNTSAGGSGVSDGLSDGLGCANHDCNISANYSQTATTQLLANALSETPNTNSTVELAVTTQKEVKAASIPSSAEKLNNSSLNVKLILEIVISLFILGSVGLWISKLRKRV